VGGDVYVYVGWRGLYRGLYPSLLGIVPYAGKRLSPTSGLDPVLPISPSWIRL